MGVESRTRECNDPAPAHGGYDCPGNRTQQQSCFQRPCPGIEYTEPVCFSYSFLVFSHYFVSVICVICMYLSRSHIIGVYLLLSHRTFWLQGESSQVQGWWLEYANTSKQTM